MLPLPRVIHLAVLSTLSATALAQAPVAPAADTKPIQQVTISAPNGGDARRDDTAGKIVVTREEILRFGDTNVGDVLKRLPGVTIAGVQGRGGEVRMRGLGAGYTRILLNGELAPPGFSLDSLSPALIERIEVIRSGTADMTAQAIAGAINIILRRPVGLAQRELKLAVGGQNDHYDRSINGRTGGKAGKLAYSLAGGVASGRFARPSQVSEDDTGSAGKAPSAQEIDSVDAGGFRNLQLVPRVTATLDGGQTVDVQSFINVRKFDGESTDRARGQVAGVPFAVFDRDLNQSTNTTMRSSVKLSHQGSGGVRGEAKLGHDYARREEAIDWRSDVSGAAGVRRQETDSDYKDTAWNTTGKYSLPHSGEHLLSVGWDAERQQRQEWHTDRITPAGGSVGAPVAQQFDATMRRIALYGQNEWTLDKHWSFYAGLRWESLAIRSEDRTGGPVRNNSRVLSPILHALWKIPGKKNDQVRLALTRTYKAPDVYKLTPRRYLSYNNSAASPDSIGNPDLRPELAWGLEGAYEHYFSGGGLVSANLYARKIDDIAITELSYEDGRWLARQANGGKARTHGIELEAKFPLRGFWPQAPAIEVRSNLAFNWSTLDSVPGPDNRLESQTPVSANIGLDYKVASLPLTLGAGFNYQGGGPVRVSAEQFSYTGPKRLVDAYGLWKFSDKTSLRISAGNMLHQEYLARKRYVDASGTLRRTTVAPTFVVVRALLEHKF